MKIIFNYTVELEGKIIEQGQIAARSAKKAKKTIEEYVRLMHGFEAYIISHVTIKEAYA